MYGSTTPAIGAAGGLTVLAFTGPGAVVPLAVLAGVLVLAGLLLLRRARLRDRQQR